MTKIDSIYQEGRHYDALFEAPNTEYWIGLAKQFGEPILELGCGTGKISIPLAEAGFEVMGLDNSNAMIEYAMKKTAAIGLAVDWQLGDMTVFSLGTKFNLILLPSNNIGHLHSLADIDDCLSCIKKHLAPGGRLAIDVFVPSLQRLMVDPDSTQTLSEYDDPDGNGRCSLTAKATYEPDAQIVRNTTCHKIPGRPDIEGTLDLKMYFPKELDAILVHSGFVIEQTYGDYGRSPFGPTSIKQLIVARLRSS